MPRGWTARPHCTPQLSRGTSTLLGRYSSTTRTSAPRMPRDLPHYRLLWKERKESLTLCRCCWTTVQMYRYATTAETFHWISHPPVGTAGLLRYSSVMMWRSMGKATTDRRHHTLRQRKETLASCVRCWIVLRMHRCATTAESLRLDRPATGTRNSRGLHDYYPKKWMRRNGWVRRGMVSMVRLNMVCVRVKLIYYSLKLWTLCMSIFWNPP